MRSSCRHAEVPAEVPAEAAKHQGRPDASMVHWFMISDLGLVCRVVRFPKLAEISSHAAGNAIKGPLAAEDSAANAGAALLLRAADRFHVAHSRFPGEHDG